MLVAISPLTPFMSWCFVKKEKSDKATYFHNSPKVLSNPLILKTKKKITFEKKKSKYNPFPYLSMGLEI